uniref:Transcription repressor n=1 Tax=Oryza barthii TaxID=65489 RepID=A0A0D3F2N9_9ORYZ
MATGNPAPPAPSTHQSRSTTPDPNASSVMRHGARVGGRARVGSNGGGHDSNNASTPMPAPVPASSSSVSMGRPSRRPWRRRMWLHESEVVVMELTEPELVDSMIEMLCTNGVRLLEDLQDLLACYLSLNAAEHHRTIIALFRRVVLV